VTVPLLRIASISKRFGPSVAVHPLSLDIAGGEYFCILGPSGSGKSTLLRMIGGFESPDTGEIHLGGKRVDHLPPEQRDSNTVFQGYALFPHLSVQENVAFGLRMKRVPEGDVQDRVAESLRLVGLADYGRRNPGTLSGGERQRVALARALVNRPRVLLLDEPLAALDRKLRLRMQDELARIQEEIGIAFVHVTHDQEEAFRLADRVAVMDKGRFLQVDEPGAVYHRPRTPFVADFLGVENLLSGHTVSLSPPEVALAGGRVVVRVAEGTPLPSNGEERVFAIRPSALRVDTAPELIRDGEEGEPRHAWCPDRGNCLPGSILSARLVGEYEELRVQAAGLEWTVRAPLARGAGVRNAGERLLLLVDPRDLLLLDPDEEALSDA